MTDNEIVKALECCVNKGYPQGCDDCPYRGLDCNERLDADALDLINRQKAEIEMNDAEIKELRIALQGYLDDVTKTRNLYKQSIEKLNQANAEIERLMLCINELKHEVGRHERNYDPSEEVDNLINNIIQPLSASAVAEMAEKAFQNHNKFEKFKAEIKSEAYKEFAEKVNREIIEAIISNDKAIAERERKHNVNRYEDNFCAMCDGKVLALSGIKSFIDNLLKELVGEDDG